MIGFLPGALRLAGTADPVAGTGSDTAPGTAAPPSLIACNQIEDLDLQTEFGGRETGALTIDHAVDTTIHGSGPWP